MPKPRTTAQLENLLYRIAQAPAVDVAGLENCDRVIHPKTGNPDNVVLELSCTDDEGLTFEFEFTEGELGSAEITGNEIAVDDTTGEQQVIYLYRQVPFLVDGPLAAPLQPGSEDEDGWVKGVISVDLSEIVKHNLEGFLDLLSERLVGNSLLMEIDYGIVGHDGDAVLLEVRGDAAMAFEL